MRKFFKLVALIATFMIVSFNNVNAESDDAAEIKDLFAKFMQLEEIEFYLVHAEEIEDGMYRNIPHQEGAPEYPVLIDGVYIEEHDFPFEGAPEDARFFYVHPNKLGFVVLHKDKVYINGSNGVLGSFEQALDTTLIYDIEELEQYAETDVYDSLYEELVFIPKDEVLDIHSMDEEEKHEIAVAILGEDVSTEEEIVFEPVFGLLNEQLNEASMRIKYGHFMITDEDGVDTHFSLMPDGTIRIYLGYPMDLEDERFTHDEAFSLEETTRVYAEYEEISLDRD